MTTERKVGKGNGSRMDREYWQEDMPLYRFDDEGAAETIISRNAINCSEPVEVECAACGTAFRRDERFQASTGAHVCSRCIADATVAHARDRAASSRS